MCPIMSRARERLPCHTSPDEDVELHGVELRVRESQSLKGTSLERSIKKTRYLQRLLLPNQSCWSSF